MQCHRLKWTLLVLFCMAPLTANAQQPRSSASRGNSQPEVRLDDLLKNSLRATTKRQLAFIDVVVLRVYEGRLSERLVKSSMQWARRRNPRIPFPYFERLMLLRALRLRVPL